MNKRTRLIIQCLLAFVITAALASCGGGATPEPTQDVGIIQTNVVQTLDAQGTETAMAMPTDTPEPTYTAVAFTPTVGEIIALPSANPSGAGLVPTVTPAGEISSAGGLVTDNATTGAAVAPTATQATAGDKASYDSQTPTDGTHFKAGESFDITWYLLNTGTTTWTTDYSLRFFTGTNFSKPGKNRYNLNAAVAPNTVGACSIDAVAPATSGSYTMSVVLGNEMDENFMIVDVTIIVD